MLGPDLPDHDDLRRAPELAHLAMVHTAASLAWQALLLENPELHDLCPPELFAGRPSLLLASVLVTRLDELTDLIAAYKASLLAVDLSAAITVIRRVGKAGEEKPIEQRPTKEESKKSDALLVGGAVAAGAGVVSLVVGTVFLGQAGAKKASQDRVVDDCVTLDDTYCTSSQGQELESLAHEEDQARTGAATAYVAGGVALAVGVTMMVVGGGGRNQERTGRFVQPFVGARSVGLVGRF